MLNENDTITRPAERVALKSCSFGSIKKREKGSLNSKIQYSKHTFTSDVVSDDYVIMGQIAVPPQTYTVVYIEAKWLTGKPLGLRIQDGTGAVLGIEETDSGYPYLTRPFHNTTVNPLTYYIYEKTSVSAAPDRRVDVLVQAFSNIS